MTKANLHSYYRKFADAENTENTKEKGPEQKRFVGLNVLPNLETQEHTPYLLDTEYEQCARELVEYADYLVLNLANTSHNEAIAQFKSEQKLRALIRKVQRSKTLEAGYQAAFDYEIKEVLKDKKVDQATIENNAFNAIYNHYDRNTPIAQRRTPLLFIKIDATMKKEELEKIGKVALEERLDGIVVGSSIEEPESKADVYGDQIGGKPTQESATEALRNLYRITQGKFCSLISSETLILHDEEQVFFIYESYKTPLDIWTVGGNTQ